MIRGHPTGVSESGPEPYRLRCLTRCRVAHLKLQPGAELLVPLDRLRVAAHLVRCRTARPLDERTRVDIELFERLRALAP